MSKSSKKSIVIKVNDQEFEVPEFARLPFDAIDVLISLTSIEEASDVAKGKGFMQAIRELKQIVPAFAIVTRQLELEEIAYFIKDWIEAGTVHGDLGKSESVEK